MNSQHGTRAGHLTNNGEGKTMHVAAKRSIVAAAAVAAAGLFGSLSYDGQMVAQSGVPTVHHDVALVDVTTALGSDAGEAAAATGPQATFLAAENVFNGEAYNAFLGPNGFEESLYNSLGNNANLFLDTYGVSGAIPTGAVPGDYTDIFNGATTQYLDGVYADGLLGEDYLNQALGISAANSDASIYAQLFGTGSPLAGGDPFLNLTSGEATQVTALEAALLGTSTTSGTADGDLAGLAQAFFTQSFTDLGGYETYLSDNAQALSAADFSLTTILGDVSSGLSTAVQGLSTDLSTFLAAITALG